MKTQKKHSSSRPTYLSGLNSRLGLRQPKSWYTPWEDTTSQPKTTKKKTLMSAILFPILLKKIQKKIKINEIAIPCIKPPEKPNVWKGRLGMGW